MYRFIILLLTAIFISHPILAQDSTLFNPSSPISHPILLSGSFGELRINHFHSGIDIKSTTGKSGDPVLAVADGFISRISVRGGGYGKAIYIDHPSGYTTVYGHLLRFTDSLETYVKQQQYLGKTFEINLYPSKEKFPVERGTIIGKMGNTGRSAAPHLHFEIRNTSSEKPINPQLFGIGPVDKRLPTISKIKIVHLLPDTTIVNQTIFKAIYIENGHYKLLRDTLSINAWRVGIEFSGFDRMTGAPNKNGLYELSLKLNGETVYQYRLDSFSFDESRHINAHINYPDFYRSKTRFQRCYVLTADPLSIYSQQASGKAIIPLFVAKKQHIEIIAKDLSGNTSILEFWLKRNQKMDEPPPLLYNYILAEGKAHLIKFEDNILYFPDTALYQSCYLYLKTGGLPEFPLASTHVYIQNGNNMFKNKVDLYLNAKNVSDSLLEKACVVSCSGKSFTSYGGEVFEDYVKVKIEKFGDYAIYIDTIAPEIKILSFQSDMSRNGMISFRISDNIQTAGNAKKISYNCYIDGTWVLFDYDEKTNTISYRFDSKFTKGKHKLKVEVIDDRNNIAIFEKSFIR